jgi:8-oxo-dGTP diphosphatase
MCLCILTRHSPTGRREILLGRKKTGFGTGKIVGLGGHVEPGETALEATVREVAEESGSRLDLPVPHKARVEHAGLRVRR